jgi:hypothetical protein
MLRVTDCFPFFFGIQLTVSVHWSAVVLKKNHRGRYKTFTFPEDDIISEMPDSLEEKHQIGSCFFIDTIEQDQQPIRSCIMKGCLTRKVPNLSEGLSKSNSFRASDHGMVFGFWFQAANRARGIRD